MAGPNPLFTKYSPGKLLLTGEYLVIHGARALATPVKFGQFMEVFPHATDNKLFWEASIQGKEWFTAAFNIPDLTLTKGSDPDKSNFLQKALAFAQKLNPSFLSEQQGFLVKTKLDYPQNWGLGSSSSFINNLSSWAQISPMDLNNALAAGSGYDIACVQANSPVLFQRVKNGFISSPVNYHPPFSDDIYFLYQEVKQNTAASVKTFLKEYRILQTDIDFVTRLTDFFLNAQEKKDAIQYMEDHEAFLGKILGKTPLKSFVFPDFPGAVKSLGAWGGDFAMILSNLDYAGTKAYFQRKGFNTLFKFEELIVDKFTD